ncbi:MAG TPA: class I SAM-dependent methyltransferase [Anaerolineaceae bacterium]|nr:class I SAM-dependent methyltransferase [Anaerolineaceae bacterium]
MNWKVKAAIQRFASVIPFGTKFYFLGQRYFGEYRKFQIETRLKFAFEMVDCLADNCENLAGKTAVEIGTGWASILPLFFWLYGLERCHTYDARRLLSPDFVKQSAQQLAECCSQDWPLITQWKHRNEYLEQERLPRLDGLATSGASAEAILKACHIDYHAPADASKTGLPDRSVDLVFSNLVLGEIPLAGLDAIFSEAYRILRPEGWMLHVIDLGDQFADQSHGVSSINFLQYSEKQFSKYNSALNYQNRLRAPAYSQLLDRHGFQIHAWRTRVDPFALSQLAKLKIHPDFAGYKPQILCTNAVTVLARKNPA